MLTVGVVAEEENAVTATAPPVETEANAQQGMVPTPEAPGEKR